MTEPWVDLPENSLAGIRHGMSHFDGVEFDLRLTRDNRLVIFHDNHLSPAQREVLDGSKWTEDHTAAELGELGIATFETLLEDAESQIQGRGLCFAQEARGARATDGQTGRRDSR